MTKPQSLNKYVDVIHELLIDQIKANRNAATRQLTTNRSIFVRLFGQLLYEAPKLRTGLVSIRLVEQKLNDFSAKGCLEHHQSRQKGGTALVDLIDWSLRTGQLPTKAQVRDIALIYCQVHYTTADENKQLRRHQKKCSSEAAYRRANIQLIDASDLFRKQGRHSDTWRQEMKAKYQPIIDNYNNPAPHLTSLPDFPIVIN